MRLTLRTLIAWLDDKLPPQEVREIGQQVAESPFAKELVERIQRVSRQRRLTVPTVTGPDPVDPNTVASYLDNELSAELVTEYEKRCLTSDVHLAEVASVHQILSLIGQKAKVPDDAKHRMYRLIKGRETTGNAPPSSVSTVRPGANGQKAPMTEPIAAWAGSISTRRPLLERFGPAIGVLGLIVVLGLAARYSLAPDSSPPKVAENPRPIEDRAGRDARSDAIFDRATPVVAAPVAAAAPKAEEPRSEDDRLPGEAGAFETIQGIVFRPSADGNDWNRVEPKVILKEKTRLLNLAPFRNTLKLGKSEVELVDSTEVVLDETEKDQPSRIELRQGQVVLRGSATPSMFSVRFEGQVLAITPPAGVNLGIERIPTLLPGQSEPAPARLRVFVPEGQAILKVGELEETLSGPSEISLQTSGQFSEKARQPVPPWVAETAPSTFVKVMGDQFVAYIKPGRPILTGLVEAMDDSDKEVKRLAILALGSLGKIDEVIAILNRKEDPTVHRAVVEVLRTGLAQGGETARLVHDGLVDTFAQPWADVTQNLILGIPPAEAKNENTMVKLVDYLTAPGRGTRELALDNLRMLTGRGDSLDYDPDLPEGRGLRAWQDLVRKKEPGKDARPGAR